LQLYSEYLHDSCFTIQPELEDVFHSYWMVSILVPSIDIRDTVRHSLASHGIETRPVFYPVHTMPMYKSSNQYYPIAEDIGARGINLPSFPGLTKKQIEYICTSLINSLSS
jgi:perosamine synthetase